MSVKMSQSSVLMWIFICLQLMDRTSLRLPPESIALQIAEFYTDLYMQRAFFASVLPFTPDVVLFLGDYFDGGPYLTDQEWVLIIDTCLYFWLSTTFYQVLLKFCNVILILLVYIPTCHGRWSGYLDIFFTKNILIQKTYCGVFGLDI